MEVENVSGTTPDWSSTTSWGDNTPIKASNLNKIEEKIKNVHDTITDITVGTNQGEIIHKYETLNGAFSALNKDIITNADDIKEISDFMQQQKFYLLNGEFNWTEHFYINANGEAVSDGTDEEEDSYYSVSDYIPLIGGQKIKFTTYINSSQGASSIDAKCVFYDNNKNKIAVASLTSGSNNSRDFNGIIPDNTAYLRVSCATRSTSDARFYAQELMKSLSEMKSIIDNGNDIIDLLDNTIKEYDKLLGNTLCIGDSLTSGSYYYNSEAPKEAYTAKENYPYYLSKITGQKTEVMALGGITIQEFWNNYKTQNFSKFNTVIIWLGTNNGIADETLPPLPDSEPTAAGCYYNLINKIITDNNNVQIFLGTVYRTTNKTVSVEETNNTINKIANLFPNNIVGIIENNDGELYALEEKLDHVIHPNNNTTHFGKIGNLYLAAHWVKGIREAIKNNLTSNNLSVQNIPVQFENYEESILTPQNVQDLLINGEYIPEIKYSLGRVNPDGTLLGTNWGCFTQGYIYVDQSSLTITTPANKKVVITKYDSNKQLISEVVSHIDNRKTINPNTTETFNPECAYVKLNVNKTDTAFYTLDDINNTNVIIKVAYKPTSSDTCYVSTTGNDNNIGTYDFPFATLEKAISIPNIKNIIVAAGTYNESVTIENRDIKLICQDGYASFTDSTNDNIITVNNCQFEFNHIITYGNKITQSNPTAAAGFKIFNSNGIFRDCKSYNNRKQQFYIDSSDITFYHCESYIDYNNQKIGEGFSIRDINNSSHLSSKCQFFNCIAHNHTQGIFALYNAQVNIIGGKYYNNTFGIYLTTGAYGEILNTLVNDNSNGIDLRGTDDNLLQVICNNNIIKNNNTGIYIAKYPVILTSNVFIANTGNITISSATQASLVEEYNSIIIPST